MNWPWKRKPKTPKPPKAPLTQAERDTRDLALGIALGVPGLRFGPRK